METSDRRGALAVLAGGRHDHETPRPRPVPQGFGIPLDDTRTPNPSTPATSLAITSTVEQLKHHSCIRWTGPAVGEGLRIDGVHVWNFTRVKGGVRVSTEETHTGAEVEADVPTATKLLRQGLEAWLRDLKTAAEAPAHNRPH